MLFSINTGRKIASKVRQNSRHSRRMEGKYFHLNEAVSDFLCQGFRALVELT